jgi:NADH-quinone oxidoreductase subunit G
MRVWFLKSVDSICTESSVGVNTEVWSREGKIYRITPRRNDWVNDTWMADSGRELYKQVEAERRLLEFRADGHKVDAAGALERAVELIRVGPVAIIGNGHLTVEEQQTLKNLASHVKAPVHLLSHVSDGDGMLISADRTPNVRGALLTGLTTTLPTDHLPAELVTALDDGSVTSLLVFGEDLAKRGIALDRLKKVNVIYFGTQSNATSDVARVVLPTLTVFEKEGSFVNQQFRLQRFRQAVPPPAGILPDRLLMSRLAALIANAHVEDPSLADIWSVLAKDVAELAGISFASIPATGIVLNHDRWRNLPFAEGETLHYKPRQEVVAAD